MHWANESNLEAMLLLTRPLSSFCSFINFLMASKIKQKMMSAFSRVLHCVVAMEMLSRTASMETFGEVLLLIKRDNELVEVAEKLGVDVIEGLEWGLLRAFITHAKAMQGVMKENEWIKRKRETPEWVARHRLLRCCSWKEKTQGDILSEGAQIKGVWRDSMSFISKTVLTNSSLITHFLRRFL